MYAISTGMITPIITFMRDLRWNDVIKWAYYEIHKSYLKNCKKKPDEKYKKKKPTAITAHRFLPESITFFRRNWKNNIRRATVTEIIIEMFAERLYHHSV